MGSVWHAVLMMVACTVLCATAIPAAHGSLKQHPLVKHKSAAAVWWFVAATFFYAAASALLILSPSMAIGLGCGFIGLFTCSGGYVSAGGGK